MSDDVIDYCETIRRLECLIQAHEYRWRGYQEVQDWIDHSLKKLKSQAARQIAQDCLDHPPSSWWERLKIR